MLVVDNKSVHMCTYAGAAVGFKETIFPLSHGEEVFRIN